MSYNIPEFILYSCLQDYNICGAFKTEKTFLKTASFYPEPTNWLSKIFGWFIILISTFELEFMLAFVMRPNQNLTKISETFLFSMTQIAFLSKLFNFILKKGNMALIERALREATFAAASAIEINVMERYATKNRIVAKVYRTLCMGCVLLYGIFPMIDARGNENKKIYPLPGLFPFDPDNYYVVVYLVEITSIAIGAWMNSTIDILFIILATVGTAQFAILGDRIRAVTSGTNYRDGLVERRLKRCVAHHHELLKLVDLIENTFSNGIFVQFFCSVVVICLTGFQMIVISLRSTQFLSLVVYFSTMMCQLIIYCWYGQLLMDKSNEITRACYEVVWNETDLATQKLLLIIMERAKKVSALRAARFFTLKLSTLMMILRSSYSYFAVLQRLYTKNY
ncbi:odorant receptor 67a-like [Cylas formicarius]|uniref:odorant receptor 67a-like n=1 Tax=Cylas formicarius TaxID=197179 RepID=UPI0029587E91|nr:odorant receptor 67a-like [Cylas formicarius]